MWRGGRGARGEGALGLIDVGVCYMRGARSRRWCGWWGRRGRWGQGWVGIAAVAWTGPKRYRGDIQGVGFRAFRLDLVRSLPLSFESCRPTAKCQTRVCVIRSLFEAQDYRFLVFIKMSPCRRPPQPRAAGRPGYPVHS